MITLVPIDGRRIVSVVVAGTQEASVFGAVPRELSAAYGSRLRLCLDWLGLKGWKQDDALLNAFQQWDAVAERIDRAAIVHRPCWNRQAALLAAVLRRNQCLVRSWAPGAKASALRWLMAEPDNPQNNAGFGLSEITGL